MAHEEVPLALPRKLPVWLMGLASTPQGFVYGFGTTAMGILLAARGVPLAKIATISFVGMSPTFWGWLLSPVIDVRFTKRAYGFFFVTLSGLLLAAAVLSIAHLTLFTALLALSVLSAVLFGSCVHGWAPDVLHKESEINTMGGWCNVANLGAAGVFTFIVIGLVRHLPIHLAAALIALTVIAPSILLAFYPPPPEPDHSLRANFGAMRRDLVKSIRGGRLWIGLALFLSPLGAFALANLFSSFGANFHATETWVTDLNGPAVAVVCSAGCLLAIPLCRRMGRRAVYIVSGVAGAACAVAMGLLPHTLTVYAAGLLAYNFFQGFSYTSYLALSFEIVGPGNALAGTLMSVFAGAANVPNTGITWVDGQAFALGGLRGMFFVDAATALAAAVVLRWLLLPWIDRWAARREAAAMTVA